MFFTNVSHEFRTPLTLIISHIDRLLQKPSLSPVVYNQALKIRKNAYQLNNLITELLEFRKLTQHHKELQVAQQDILNFVKENYLSFVDQARLRNITYTFDQPDTPVLCWFDASLMERVFSNLISNAFKYTPDGGSIRLSGRQTGEEVEISIADTGIGIAEVSDRCGFSTPVYFSQCFKKQYGMTPQAYRKQQVTAPE